MEKTPVSPGQSLLGPEMDPGVTGLVIWYATGVQVSGLVPQILLAVTHMLPWIPFCTAVAVQLTTILFVP
jgi:hypothetical protein